MINENITKYSERKNEQLNHLKDFFFFLRVEQINNKAQSCSHELLHPSYMCCWAMEEFAHMPEGQSTRAEITVFTSRDGVQCSVKICYLCIYAIYIYCIQYMDLILVCKRCWLHRDVKMYMGNTFRNSPIQPDTTL